MIKNNFPEEIMATMQEVEQKQLIHYGVEGGVAIIEMDDPPANTYTYEMMQQIDTAILQARMDENAHVIVLRGKGEKFFSFRPARVFPC
jgi:enoyl-CoA hydratase